MITYQTEDSIDMQRELNALAKEFDRQPVSVMRTNLNLYQKSISTVAAPFLKQVTALAKKSKTNEIVLIAIIKEVHQ
jgi:hypothetical protein